MPLLTSHASPVTRHPLPDYLYTEYLYCPSPSSRLNFAGNASATRA